MSTDSKNKILWTKHELIKASKGKDLTRKFLNNKKITGISIDTRSIEQNDLFIAIKGKNYDGHNFLEKAVQKGASGVIVSNNNNIIGLSLSLMKLPYDFHYCILELGMSKKNELRKLSLVSKPDLIIISNVSNNHLENFKSEKDIALAKSEIFHGLEKDGQIVLNYDDKWFNFLKKIALNYTDQVIPFGIKKSIFSIFQEKDVFLIKSKNFKTNLYHLPRHLALNLISILTLIKCLNLDLNKIKEKIKYL